MKYGKLFPAVILLLGLSACSKPDLPVAHAGILDLRGPPLMERMDLGGQWEIYWMKLLEPEVFREKTAPLPTGYLMMPGPWTGKKLNGKTLPDWGYATLRLKILLPPETEDPLMVKINFCLTACRLYANGILIHTSGRVALRAEDSLQIFEPGDARLFPRGRPAGVKEVELVLQISNHFNSHGGILGQVWLGPESVIRKGREWSMALDLMLFACFWVMGFTNLVLYAMNRQDASPLYFALFAFVISLRILVFGESWLVELLPGLSAENFERFSVMPLVAALLFFALYTNSMFRRQYPRVLLQIQIVLAAIVLPLDAVAPGFYIRYLNAPVAYLLPIVFASNLIVMIRAVLHGSWEAIILLSGMFLILVAVLFDFTNFLYDSSVQPMAPFGFLLFIASQNLILSRRFYLAYRHINALSSRLAARNRRLTELDRLKNEFLANTSHELRTPLQGIIGLAETLRSSLKARINNHESESLDLIMFSGKRLARLVNDLLDFTRVKNRDLILHRSPVDIRSAVQLTLEMQRPLAQEKGLELKNQVPLGLPPVKADEDRLLQILSNLVGNAVKFTEQGEISVSGELMVNDELLVRVRDTGPGIPLEKQGQIFKPFVQVDGAGDRAQEGLGLGLSITRKLVELHYGILTLRSKPGDGASFNFTLPVYDEIPEWQPQQFEPTENAALENGNVIYFVDDDPVNLRVGGDTLRQAGYTVRTFHSGPAALDALEKDEKPSLVVLDVMMPGMTGYEACGEIRKFYAAHELPVLMLTARSRTQDFTAGLNCGANDFLTKPCESETLLARVGNLLKLEQAGREKEFAETNVREQMYRDLHDHLGGRLYDLKSMAGRLELGEATEPEVLAELRENIGQSISDLRSALAANQETRYIKDSYLDGLHYILNKRYKSYERELNFEYESELHDILNGKQYERLKSIFYSVITEISNNDLKYGRGISRWKLARHQDGLIFRMESGSDYQPTRRLSGNGNGTGNIITRVSQMGGEVNTKLGEGSFIIEITVPLKADTAL